MTCVICNESLSTQQSCTIYLITIKLWVTLCVHFGEFNWKGFRSSYLSHCATEQKLLVLLENPFLLVSYIYTSNNFHVHFNLDKFNNFDDFKPYWWLFMALHFKPYWSLYLYIWSILMAHVFLNFLQETGCFHLIFLILVKNYILIHF